MENLKILKITKILINNKKVTQNKTNKQTKKTKKKKKEKNFPFKHN